MNAKERHIVIVNFTTSESSQAQAIQEPAILRTIAQTHNIANLKLEIEV